MRDVNHALRHEGRNGVHTDSPEPDLPPLTWT
ncbi:hypothetical protein EKD16_06715 [Streptomonospora litoralis]|uniref:Uncharacterized protein n=1 Tax=Streptomonospora litoralis TaxID=2498135 RepID=A0A4P6PZF2_9ACTN|nr:hypothetical protein EKD16_06715 [Streptomonospora litoralis]